MAELMPVLLTLPYAGRVAPDYSREFGFYPMRKHFDFSLRVKSCGEHHTVHAKFAQDILTVGLHGMDTDEQRVCYLRRTHSFAEFLKNLGFAI